MRPVPPLLDVQALSVAFGKPQAPKPALEKVSFVVQPGEVVALVGESGSGKSVTAMSVMQLIGREGGRITGGRMLFSPDGAAPVDLAQLEEEKLRRLRGREIAMIFQEPMTSLNPIKTVGVQLAEVLVLHQGASWKAATAEAQRMLDRVHMTEPARRMGQYPHELSGGMRQRVMIGMALLCRPKLLIADEPTTALDVTVQAQIVVLLQELQRETGTAVLFISHDLALVSQIASRVVVMRHGQVVEQAPRDSLLAAPTQPYTRMLLDAAPRLGGGSPAPLPAAAPLLSVRGLSKTFPTPKGPVQAVADVGFDLQAGETLALIGESGCGKSTTARMVMRLIEPTSGSVSIDGRDITALSPRQMQPVRRAMQMVFQDPYASLNPRLSAFDAITEPLAIHAPRMPRAERRARAEAVLRQVHLPADSLDRYPHQFSGGQRQRLCIARALSLEPRILVADEAVSALDVSVQMQVVALLQELQQRLGLACLFISHDIGVVERISHRIAVMRAGRIVESGATQDILRAPREAYTQQLIAAVPRLPQPRAVQEAMVPA
ncbi:ABC transporter ATP-binding protein [Pseudoroseomonas deserti]|uniref:ABC transporter ATP-binding protein n=1 Tax=Teichococcus deserti TaxID=1817963 RepID=A0A1V2GZ08_9PROT|nr:ABC transporter ATP-binding protein [Pseudoroseomonas deserti]ONG50097.1 ABC transporter ATP-binding protein [Pseudoroseomonas deserti]